MQASGGERSRASGGAEGRRRRDVSESGGGGVKESGETEAGQRGQETYMTGGPAIFLNAGRSDA